MRDTGILNRLRPTARLQLLAAARSDRPWSATILQMVRIVSAALIATYGAASTSASMAVLATGPLGWVGVGTTAAATAAMVVVLVGGIERFAAHLAAVGLVMVGITLSIFAGWSAGVEDPLWWPTQFVFSTMLFAAVAGRTWRRAILVVLGLMFHTAARLAVWHADGLPFSLDVARTLAVELGLASYSAFLLFMALETFLRAGQLTDEARATAAREAGREATAIARERSAREVERFIHDEILHSLRTIALDRQAVTTWDAREAASRLDRLLVEAARSPDNRGHLAERIEASAERLPLTVTVHSEHAVVVPEEVEAAIVRAAMEALRNVRRHAGTDRATVRVSREGLSTTVTVTDDGVGFDLAEVDQRWGLRSSVRQRMWDVGGDVDIRTGTGEGTTLTLSWSPVGPKPSPRFRSSAGYGALSRLYGLASWIVVPYFAFALWNTAWLAPLLAEPWAGWVSTLILIAATAAIVADSLRRGPRPVYAALLVLIALGTTALNGWALPDGVRMPYLFWAGQSSFVVLVPLTLLYWPPLILLTGFLTSGTVLAFSLAAAGPEAVAATFIPTIAVPLLGAVCYWAVRIATDQLAWEIHRTGEASVQSRAAAQTHAEFVAELAVRMKERLWDIALFVREVASGDLDPDDPSVRARADAFERAARDQMIPDVDARLRNTAAWMRELGHTASLRLAEDAPADVQWLGARALEKVVDVCDHETLDATLTIMRAGAQWRTALKIGAPGRHLGERLKDLLGPDWTISQNPDLLHLSTMSPVMAENVHQFGAGKGA